MMPQLASCVGTVHPTMGTSSPSPSSSTFGVVFLKFNCWFIAPYVYINRPSLVISIGNLKHTSLMPLQPQAHYLWGMVFPQPSAKKSKVELLRNHLKAKGYARYIRLVSELESKANDTGKSWGTRSTLRECRSWTDALMDNKKDVGRIISLSFPN